MVFIFQRQAERIKREKAQIKRGDDIDPQVRTDLIVPVTRFQGSRLASGALPSPYQQIGSSYNLESTVSMRRENQVGRSTGAMPVDIQTSRSRTYDSKGVNDRARKIARLSSSGATIGAAIVEAENSFEVEVSLLIYAFDFTLC